MQSLCGRFATLAAMWMPRGPVQHSLQQCCNSCSVSTCFLAPELGSQKMAAWCEERVRTQQCSPSLSVPRQTQASMPKPSSRLHKSTAFSACIYKPPQCHDPTHAGPGGRWRLGSTWAWLIAPAYCMGCSTGKLTLHMGMQKYRKLRDLAR